MTRLNEASAMLRSAKEEIAVLPPTELLSWIQALLNSGEKIVDGLQLAEELPSRELMELIPDLVRMARDEVLHELICKLLGKLPFDAAAELIVPEAFRVLREPSSDYWVVWMQARLFHYLGYHRALRHIVTMAEETMDEGWRMVGEWVEVELLSEASSEASRI